MLQVAHPIAEELLARYVNQGQALLARASLVGDLTDYEGWKADRRQWTGQAAEALGHIYISAEEAEQFTDAATGSSGAKRWQQQYAADVACVEAALKMLSKHLHELDPTYELEPTQATRGRADVVEPEPKPEPAPDPAAEPERPTDPEPSEEINPFERPDREFARDSGEEPDEVPRRADPVKPAREPDPDSDFERSGPYGGPEQATPAVGSELAPAGSTNGSEVIAQAGNGAVAIPDRMRHVFLAHGRDERWMQAVAQLLERSGPHSVTVLNDRPTDRQIFSQEFGQQVEGTHYAVVLLTADDVGAPRLQSDEEPYYSPRARQGVVFEMGFLVAALTPGCVCVLYEDGVELPCDLDGIAYVRLDFAGTWQAKLLLQLRKAGFNYDVNRLAPV